MRVREDYRTLTGPEKAAILMLSIGEDQASRLFVLMDDEEIKQVSQMMSNLGTVHASVIERLFSEFANQVSPTGLLAGGAGTADRLLEKILNSDRAGSVTEETRGAGGLLPRSKLPDVNESALTASLPNEHPQTAAIVLSKLQPEPMARVLTQLPEAFATEVIMRMQRLESGAKGAAGDHERAADRRFTVEMNERSRTSAKHLAAMTFGFEDLGRLAPSSVQTLLRHADRVKLALALKGASEPLREMFYANLSERAGKQLREDVFSLAATKLRDVDEAQGYIVALANKLGAKDEIALLDAPADDELIY